MPTGYKQNEIFRIIKVMPNFNQLSMKIVFLLIKVKLKNVCYTTLKTWKDHYPRPINIGYPCDQDIPPLVVTWLLQLLALSNKLYLTLCIIWYHLYNFKNVKNTHGWVVLLVKLQTETCNFTKSNISPWMFFHVFQILQMVKNRTKHHIYKGNYQ